MKGGNNPKCHSTACAALMPAALLFSTVALAAIEPETPPQAPHLVTDAGESIEEIEVVGQRQLFVFRIEMLEAEERMYSLFNSLNSSDRFDVKCEERVVINSHIERHFCDRKYVDDARMQNLQDWMRGVAMLKGDAQIWTENEGNHEQFRVELKAAAEQHPEMLAAIVDVVEKRKRYDAVRRSRASESFLGRLLTGQQDEVP